MSQRKTPSHNAATNCYRFIRTLAGNLSCQLRTTRVNFFAASRSALGILPRKNTKCRGGRIPRCATAARLDGSMTLMHVCGAFGTPAHGPQPSWGRRAGPTSDLVFRQPFYDFRSIVRLLACSGSAICLSLAHVRCIDEMSSPGGLPWEAVSQLGTTGGVSVLNVEHALQLDPGSHQQLTRTVVAR